MQTLDGATAVITGGGSGMGRAVALRLARAGANVVVADVDGERAEAVADTARGDGAEAVAVAVDVRDADANHQLLDTTIDAFGACNVVMLNAGVAGSAGRSWHLTEEDWEFTLGVNLWGVINGVRAFVPHLVEHGNGHVVATASIAGHVAGAHASPYGVSKFGVVALMESLHHELRLDKADVGVTCLCPGFVNTDIVNPDRSEADGTVGRPRDERGERWYAMSRRALETGLDPDVVGDLVHDAILADQFWLFTDDWWDQAIEERAAAILAREPSVLGMPNPPSS
ncbi:MAG: SDR family NAD(P)-dependent oxidoreductase [Actinomycetota bacterium]